MDHAETRFFPDIIAMTPRPTNAPDHHRLMAFGVFSLLMMPLAGCTGPSGSFPPLDLRPVETAKPVEAAPKPVTFVLTEAALATFETRITAAETAAKSSDTAFNKALPAIRRTVTAGQGAAMGSDAWLEAQQALSRLEQSRAGAEAARADLDIVLRELSVVSEPRLQTRTDSARETIHAIANAQQAQFTTLAVLLN